MAMWPHPSCRSPGPRTSASNSSACRNPTTCPGGASVFAWAIPRLSPRLTRIKSYLDYGMFQPIQIAATVALNGSEECVRETVRIYQTRRDVLVDGLNRIGWPCTKPVGTMFVWAEIPQRHREMGSLAEVSAPRRTWFPCAWCKAIRSGSARLRGHPACLVVRTVSRTPEEFVQRHSRGDLDRLEHAS